MDLGVQVAEGGRLVSEEKLADNTHLKTHPAHEVSDEHLKQWIEFLRNCEGFAVW